MASRTPIEMMFFISFAFLAMLRRNIKRLQMYFSLRFFFETIQLWIDSKDQLSFRYMNPYDVRKLTSRNLTYFQNSQGTHFPAAAALLTAVRGQEGCSSSLSPCALFLAFATFLDPVFIQLLLPAGRQKSICQVPSKVVIL